ncbi:uncharacterized protein [Apostichopus japonicus]|uniref:uncharacterized protein n=1 Tax=Stichopus japonicus TaxID=307972 RepID=UPI003AB15A38
MAHQSEIPLNRIFLWASPRSISTAFEKCVTQMEGAMVWHEPYCSIYFNRVFQNPETFVKFPRMKALGSQFQKAVKMFDSVKGQYEGGNLERAENFTYEYIKEQLEKPLDEGKKFLLIKDMALGIDGNYDLLPKGPFRHTFLIRHPNRTSLSVRKLVAHVYEYEGDLDKFVEMQKGHPFMSWDMLSVDPLYNLYKYVKENIDPNPVVIDADDLQNHPDKILKKYCEAVGIPWDDKYLTWNASDEFLKYMHGAVEQIILGKIQGVYDRAFGSTQFYRSDGKPPIEIPEVCRMYADEFREGYKVMYENRLKPE